MPYPSPLTDRDALLDRLQHYVNLCRSREAPNVERKVSADIERIRSDGVENYYRDEYMEFHGEMMEHYPNTYHPLANAKDAEKYGCAGIWEGRR